MGLKDCPPDVVEDGRELDKIRPKWDWKQNFWNLLTPIMFPDKIRPKWDWKPALTPVTSVVYTKIKSDQNGIESLKSQTPFRGGTGLIKSDQNGIESNLFIVHTPTSNYDKIRPKWDWKFVCRMNCTASSATIKSDQNGIESLTPQRRKEEKDPDKIRPKWDWKLLACSIAPSISSDKIRPKWDWKQVR